MAVLCKGIEFLKEELPAYSLNDNIPVPQRSVVSFVDVLGYRAKVLEAAKQGQTTVFLNDFRKALVEATNYLKNDGPCYAFSFTDSIVVGWPVVNDDDSEVPLCISCWNLAAYQLTMTKSNLFVRGGVAVGEAYFDEYVQSGEAFLNAYEAERHQAIYPRIVLSEDAVAEVQQICGYYTDKGCPLNALFAVDADGAIFVNYLSSLFGIFNTETGRQEIEKSLAAHKDAIERNLKVTANDPHLYRKYQWAARYHDFFCEGNSKRLRTDLYISVNYGKERFAPPRSLLDVFPDWIA